MERAQSASSRRRLLSAGASLHMGILGMLFGGDAHDLEDALQFIVTEEADVERAFALPVTELNLGAETLAQFRFKVGDMNIADGGHCRATAAAALGRLAGRMLLQA